MNYQNKPRSSQKGREPKQQFPASGLKEIIKSCNNKWAVVTLEDNIKYYGLISFFDDVYGSNLIKCALNNCFKIPSAPNALITQESRIQIKDYKFKSIVLTVDIQGENKKTPSAIKLENECASRNVSVPADTLENLSSKIEGKFLNKFKSEFNEDAYSVALNEEMVNTHRLEAEIKANSINSEKTTNYHLAQERNQITASNSMNEEENYSSVVLKKLVIDKNSVNSPAPSVDLKPVWNVNIFPINHTVRSMLTLKQAPKVNPTPTITMHAPPTPHSQVPQSQSQVYHYIQQNFPHGFQPILRHPVQYHNDPQVLLQPSHNQFNQQH